MAACSSALTDIRPLNANAEELTLLARELCSPGKGMDLNISTDQAVSNSMKFCKAVDNSSPTKGDALPSCFDFDLHASIRQLEQCLQRTPIPAMPTPPTSSLATAYPDT